MEHVDRGGESLLGLLHQLRGEPDLGHEDEHAPTAVVGSLRRVQVHLGLPAPGDAVQEEGGEAPARLVDGTGGGDAFDAGFVYGLLKGLETEECLRYATALGASCVRAVGTTTGVFTREECEEFMGRHPLLIERL